MSNCCTQDARGPAADAFEAWAPKRLPDPADIPRPLWRDALRLVAAPVARMHRYRNMRAALIRAAMDNLGKEESR